ncbi:hypothetical protein V6N12_069198 [Hibiscus sabdariffa]|uniref:DUF4283 domain-containing protein n=1 Tax=Hibiscus sabdariffa TaxID=183260 RepID=A0ABR2FD78_9ROSI
MQEIMKHKAGASHGVASTEIRSRLRDNRTYKEALTLGRPVEARAKESVKRKSIKENKGLTVETSKDNLIIQGGLHAENDSPGVHIVIPIEEMLWLKRCLAGKVHAMYNGELVHQALVADGFKCTISPWHGDLVIVCFESDELVKDTWGRKEQLLNCWFDFIEPLALSESKQRVKVWVILEEVPLSIWHNVFFANIAMDDWKTRIAVRTECFEEETVWIDDEKVISQRNDLHTKATRSLPSFSDEHWDDLWASDSEPWYSPLNEENNYNNETEPQDDSSRVNGTCTAQKVGSQRVRSEYENLSVERSMLGLDTPQNEILGSAQHEGDNQGFADLGLHDVPVLAVLESVESSLVIRNDQGLLISGVGPRGTANKPNDVLIRKTKKGSTGRSGSKRKNHESWPFLCTTSIFKPHFTGK